MSSAIEALRTIADDLERRGWHWALVGGFAVSARAEPRFTRDVDVAVAVADDRAAEETVRSLIDQGYRPLGTVEQDETNRLAIARLTHARRGREEAEVAVDLLFASSGLEPEIVKEAERIEILPGLVVPVARTGHLIALKVLARDDRSRPQDLADLNALIAVATPADLSLAREAVGVIASRGFARGRDLHVALNQLLAEGAGPDPQA